MAIDLTATGTSTVGSQPQAPVTSVGIYNTINQSGPTPGGTLTEHAYTNAEPIVIGTAGNDYLHPADATVAAATTAFTIVGGSGNDLLVGAAGNDDIYASGPTANTAIAGAAAAGTDTGPTTSGNVTATGNFNVLEGGAGDDQLYAGPGSDSFFFGNASGNDVIHGFDVQNDDLYLLHNLNNSNIATVADLPTHITDVPAVAGLHLAGVQIDLGGGNTVVIEGIDTTQLGLNTPQPELALLTLFNII